MNQVHVEPTKTREIEPATHAVQAPSANLKRCSRFRGSDYFTKWVTISHAFEPGDDERAAILAIGMGTGRNTVLPAETAFRPLPLNIVRTDISPQGSMWLSPRPVAPIAIDTRGGTA